MLALGVVFFLLNSAWAEIPALPKGGETLWAMDGVQELVCYATFDPGKVMPLLPTDFRFINIKEVAAGGAQWAKDYLVKHPLHARWGISFLEIVQAKEFSIDGKAPCWPADGAVALWCARIAATGARNEYARPFLLLAFWIPDRDYAAYMRQKGHYATFGDVTLRKEADGSLIGSVQTESLSIKAACRPVGPVSGGDQAAGTQTLIPPATASMFHYVQIVFAGHREQECSEGAVWSIAGSHPLASSLVLEPSSFQFGYHLLGSAYVLSGDRASDKTPTQHPGELEHTKAVGK
jgi:hypothetical protein